MSKSHKVTVRIEEDLRRRAHEASIEMGMSLSEYVYRQISLLVETKDLRDRLEIVESELNKIPRHVGVNSLLMSDKR